MADAGLSRRRFCGGVLAAGGLSATGLGASGLAGFGGSAQAASPTGARLAAIDWAMLETAVAIGHMPVAACELIQFRATAVQPKIPQDVVDLGLRGAPNFELLQLVRPDLILSSPYYTAAEGRMRAIAPVLSLPFYLPGEPPLPKAITALGALADAVGDPEAGPAAAARAEAAFDVARASLSGHDARDGRPVCVINIGDARHFRAFGPDSLFGNVLTRLGVANAWQRPTQFAFLAPVPIETLAQFPDATLVIVSDVPVEARRALDRSVLWQALPPVRAGRVHTLPDVSAFGGVLAAQRFAMLLTAALTSPATGLGP